MPPFRPGLLAVLLAVPLCACQSSAPPPAPIAAAMPAVPPLPPEGSGCAPTIARTKAIVASDLATGNLNDPVAKRFDADLDAAAAACAAGRSAEALHLHAAAKARYGYR
ncbi:hypothetical protein [Methylobacterium organophilum]|uniref:Uncharacterized protein n=1 Tax=Methylobacterium organophilum TaxID=410 RepID=A0ABQ4TEQ2_METOR|nr:hypothetical protein [Methylobacterium organophilum]GJE28507.1 hypothetical protein LKMONMHP_3378 [Methylobacterium organophilum]